MLWETVEVMLTALRDKCSTSAGGGGGGGTGVAAAAGALSSSAAAAAAGGRAGEREAALPAGCTVLHAEGMMATIDTCHPDVFAALLAFTDAWAGKFKQLGRQL
jgi:hypothetical protein